MILNGSKSATRREVAYLSSPSKPAPSSIFTNAVWEGAPLGSDDYVISADEKTSIQARRPKQPTLPPAPHRPTKVENEYFRQGAWVYFGRSESQNGMAPVARVVGEVMGQEPYNSARRVFWIMDNCSAHRGQKAIDRFHAQWPNAILVYTPVHASWLNQVRDLLFDCPALGPHAEQFRFSG